jgi:hypothetical protein
MEAGRTARPYRRNVQELADALGLAAGERDLLIRLAREGAGPPPEPRRPAQLPADIAEFTGRAEQVDSLTALLAGSGQPVRIAVITGAGGVGKSALAIHVAHQVSAAFGDGQLFVELQGSSEHPVSTSEVLARLLRQLGMADAAIPAEATGAVLTACGGLPLAIRIAAARLVSRPAWEVGALANRLRDERQRLSELAVGDLAVRASFEVSYANLPAARAFRLLGLWPGADLSLPAAAALLGLPAAGRSPHRSAAASRPPRPGAQAGRHAEALSSAEQALEISQRVHDDYHEAALDQPGEA